MRLIYAESWLAENEVALDITEKARLEQMKSEFINRASHELRTPLTTVMMMVDLIQEGGDPEELAEYWSILRLELSRQQELIEDLLTVGRLENGTMQIKPRPLNVTPLLYETIRTLLPLAHEKGVEIRQNISEELPQIRGEQRALKQVFNNLLNNAIKFTPPDGNVFIEAFCQNGRTIIRICDSGIGIPDKDKPQIFDRFFRARNAQQQEIPGSGMGLYITKSIITQLGGTITVDSQVDQGTTFEITWPTHNPNQPTN